MIRSRIALLALLFALCSASLAAPGALARQGDDCAGIDDYVAAINATGNPVTAPESADLPDGFMDEWNPEELAMASAELAQVQSELEEIEPPAVAEAFHADLVESMGVLVGMIDAVAESGIDGGMAFVDQLAELDERLYNDGVVVEDTCQVALLDHDLDGEAEIGEGAGFEAVEAATIEVPANPPAGAEPVPAGTAAALDADWELTVVSFTPDATADVLAYDPSNTPPADGMTYAIARVSVTNTGAVDGSFSDWRLSLLDSTGQSYSPFVDSCGFFPDELPMDTVAPGGSVEGNVCWAIPVAESASPAGLVIYDGNTLPEMSVHFSLDVPAGAAPATSAGGGFADAVGNAGDAALSGLGTPEAGN